MSKQQRFYKDQCGAQSQTVSEKDVPLSCFVAYENEEFGRSALTQEFKGKSIIEYSRSMFLSENKGKIKTFSSENFHFKALLFWHVY